MGAFEGLQVASYVVQILTSQLRYGISAKNPERMFNVNDQVLVDFFLALKNAHAMM